MKTPTTVAQAEIVWQRKNNTKITLSEYVRNRLGKTSLSVLATKLSVETQYPFTDKILWKLLYPDREFPVPNDQNAPTTANVKE